MTNRDILLTAVKAADDKRAEDIITLKMAGISLIADYFVICHGNSDKQVQAIAREIKDQANEKGFHLNVSKDSMKHAGTGRYGRCCCACFPS